ncbi:MAG: hypothetical protein HQ453_07085, partial [Actinobacteria bacterium]|nr:hypothetical protein [Actinomycetota bacterium]
TLHRDRFSEHRIPESRREGFGREDIDGNAEKGEQLVTNRAHIKERRFGGRVVEEVEVAFARVVASRGRANTRGFVAWWAETMSRTSWR